MAGWTALQPYPGSRLRSAGTTADQGVVQITATVTGWVDASSLRPDPCQPVAAPSGPSGCVSVRGFVPVKTGAPLVTVPLKTLPRSTPPPTVAAPDGHSTRTAAKLPDVADIVFTTELVRLAAAVEQMTAILNFMAVVESLRAEPCQPSGAPFGPVGANSRRLPA